MTEKKLRVFLPEADVKLVIEALHQLHDTDARFMSGIDRMRAANLAAELERPPADAYQDEPDTKEWCGPDGNERHAYQVFGTEETGPNLFCQSCGKVVSL